jgi:hypothetical protein
MKIRKESRIMFRNKHRNRNRDLKALLAEIRIRYVPMLDIAARLPKNCGKCLRISFNTVRSRNRLEVSFHIHARFYHNEEPL